MFKSNAVRSCVELHEVELKRFYDTWEAFRASGAPLPQTDDPSYASPDHLGGHERVVEHRRVRLRRSEHPPDSERERLAQEREAWTHEGGERAHAGDA